MTQFRVKSGKDFELSLEKDGWKLRATSPRLKWIGNGFTNIDKIKNCINDPSKLVLNEYGSNYVKYDLIHSETKQVREAKKYLKYQLNEWVLYSEPYFKIATKQDAQKISVKDYNTFVEKFFEHNLSTGLFERVMKKIASTSEGVIIKDDFIPKDELEFRTVLLKQTWGGYHRITIQCRLKQ
jgi:hypothetical protein